ELPPGRRSESPLAANGGIRLRHLLHHSLGGEESGQRRAPIAPVFPGVIRPILIARAIGRGGVKPEGLEKLCIAPRSVRLLKGVPFLALGKTCQRVGFACIRPFLIPSPSLCEIWLECTLRNALRD